jgi:hypothetical protein
MRPRVSSPPLGAERPGEVGAKYDHAYPGRTEEKPLPQSVGQGRHPIEPDTRGPAPAIHVFTGRVRDVDGHRIPGTGRGHGAATTT